MATLDGVGPFITLNFEFNVGTSRTGLQRRSKVVIKAIDSVV